MLTRLAAAAPMPATDAVARLGKRSVGSVQTIADQAWWTPQAIAMRTMAIAGLLMKPAVMIIGDATIVSVSIVAFLAALRPQPRFTSADDTKPAVSDPMSAQI